MFLPSIQRSSSLLQISLLADHLFLTLKGCLRTNGDTDFEDNYDSMLALDWRKTIYEFPLMVFNSKQEVNRSTKPL